MERREIWHALRDKERAFMALPEQVQKENKSVLGFIREQRRACNWGTVKRNGNFWHPQALFRFRDAEKFGSIKEYFDKMGESIANIIAIKPLCVYISAENRYIEI